MGRIPEQIIERVIETADIIEVISSRIELKKRGINFWALCPFHTEKTPSFSVSPTKQIYTCFGGCGAKGGVVNFLMQYDRLEFIEAITKLGQMYNIEIETDERAIQTKNIKSQLLEIYRIVSEYYQKALHDKKNEKYLQYLKTRNINDKMIDLFDLGCSDKDSSDLLNILRNKKFSTEAMKKSGLFINSKNGYFETFNSRVIFPIKNPSGEVIAFAGRVLDNKPKMRKFINSYDSPIYYKSKNLYGLEVAREFIQEKQFVFLVEGQWDVIRLYQNNIRNVIGIGGTSLTDLQASIIKQYTSNIFILLDGDDAGIKAAIRSGYTLLKNSINSKIICPPNQYDPDDWLNTNNGKKELLEAKESAPFTIQFHYDMCDKSTNNATNDFIEEVMNNIIEIEDPIFRELTAKSLAEAVNINEETILYTINNKILKNKKRHIKRVESPASSQVTNENKTTLIEDDLIRLCLIGEIESRQIIFENLSKDWLLSEIHQNIYDKIYMHLNSNYEIPIDLIINKTDDNDTRSKVIDLSENTDKLNSSVQMAIDCLIRLEGRVLKKNILGLREQIKTANEDEINSIIEQISTIQKEIDGLMSKYQ